ncbi:MAG TPA: response regulator [Verrucomicrobiae bacterium]|nr:response regulator [Verrucomicrobiae bacterium]
MSAITGLILAAEDEETDRFILNLAFERAAVPASVVMVNDGAECVDYLRGNGRFADRALHPLPTLLLLDLKMPRMHGFEVLEWLGTQPELKDLPAVVLSSSSDESDIQKARRLGARDYFVKPQSLDDLVGILHQVYERWMR